MDFINLNIELDWKILLACIVLLYQSNLPLRFQVTEIIDVSTYAGATQKSLA